MGENVLFRFNRRSYMALFLVFALLFSMVSAFIAKPALAKTSARTAIVVDASGDVNVKKAGGSKTYKAYKDMSLNQGDYISTGDKSSVTLRIADHQDEITIGDNSEFYISDLSNQGDGKVSKFKLWAGSTWMKVKSLVSSDDEFEVETPTAVMGVRGTSGFTSVDPSTGQTSITVTAGVVQVTTTTAQGNPNSNRSTQENRTVMVYPSQQITLNARPDAPDLRANVTYMNVNELVGNVSPSVIEAFLKGLPEVIKENNEIKDKLQQNLNQGVPLPEGSSILSIQSQDDLNRIAQNFTNMVANIVKAAVDAGKLAQTVIDSVNAAITDPTQKIDLTKPITPLDTQAGVDPSLDTIRQQAPAPSTAIQQEVQAMLSTQQALKDLQSLLQSFEAVRTANAQATAAAQQQAIAAYIATLSEAEKQRFQQSQNSNNQQSGTTPTTPTTPTTTTTPNSGTGGTSTSPNRPAAPTLVSPTGPIGTLPDAPVIVKAKAPAGTLIRLSDDSKTYAEATGNNDAEVSLTFTLPTVGTYSNLKLYTVRSGLLSSAVTVPTITVVNLPAKPTLVSPTADVVGASATVVAKAAAGSKIVVLNNGSLIAEAPGNGANDVSIALPLGAGVFDKLSIVTEASGVRGEAVALPKITIINAGLPTVVSPTADLITKTPVIVARAAAGAKMIVLNGTLEIASANGKDTENVSIPLALSDGVYDNLYLVLEVSGVRGQLVKLPKITVDKDMAVILKSATKANQTVTATITMKNFVNPNVIYAAEVHLLYDNRLSYTGLEVLPKEQNSSTIFGSQANSVEMIRQVAGTSEKELIYIATNYELGGTTVDNFVVDQEKVLVNIPLTLTGTDLNDLKVKMIYFKVVNKNGDTVLDGSGLLTNPVTMPVHN